MTGRDLLLHVVNGGVPERALSIVPKGSEGDCVLCELGEVDGQSSVAQLCRVKSPLARALASGEEIVELLDTDVEQGAERLRELTEATRNEMAEAVSVHADGIVYELDGAYPSVSSPMQYGGHFLEIDRALLAEAKQSTATVLWVRGEDSPYIDFVSDLPSHVFVWDSGAGVTVEEVAELRTGALAGREVEFQPGVLARHGG